MTLKRFIRLSATEIDLSTSGCMYRIMQSTTLDGKHLLKLIPLVNNTIHFFSAVPLPLSTSSTSTKVNMIPIATRSCSAPTTCLPFFQNSKKGSILITSVEAPENNNKVHPANSTHKKVPAASPALQNLNPTTVTFSGLPIHTTQLVATSATDKGSCSLKTVTYNSPALPNTQLSSLPEQNTCKTALRAVADQKTQPSPTSTPDQMGCEVATVTLHGSAVQRTEASPKGMQTQCTMPGASVQKSHTSPISTADQKTFVLLKTSVLPSGHYLQIPANAEVKSVPASLLPGPIQQKILTTVASNLANRNKSAKTLPNVIYVCPVNTVKTMPKRLPNICPKNTVEVPMVLLADNSTGPSLESPANSGAVSNVNQSKFEDNPLKSAMNKNQILSRCLIPVKSSNDLASMILKNLADQQRAKEGLINLLPQPSPVLPTETEADFFSPSKENALVMFNSKVYLVIQKNCGSSSPGPRMVSTSEKQTEKEDTSSIILPQTNLQIKIKEEPKDPDFEPVKQKATHLECWPTERCNVQSFSNQHGGQGTPFKQEHMELFCKRAGVETDEQLLKRAGICTKLRICLTRISPKELEQWEKSNSPAISETLKAPTHQTKRKDDVSTDIVCEETQGNVMLPVVKEEPIDPDDDTCQIKDVEIKVEPKSPVKRKTESINCSIAVKKQCLSSIASNWQAEHAYTCLPVCNTEEPTLSTDEISHFDSHSELGALASTTEPSYMPEKDLVVECSPFATFSSVADDLFSDPSNIPALSISSLSTEQSSPTGISTALTSLPLSVDETTRDEKIRRLKEILKEKEAALEAMRKKMIKAKLSTKRKSEKHQDKKSALNRESKCTCSCLWEKHPDRPTCINLCRRQGMFAGSMHARSRQDKTKTSHVVTHSTEANKVLGISAVSEAHFTKILPSSSVGKTTRDEKIRRLKEILKEKEAALETIRRNKVSAPLQDPQFKSGNPYLDAK
ncbi:ligand-dependent nuclear receptor-interacting factor 1-like isoform X2 [Narcine bancroftii]|uniref:ligand-dependent nuclear receptor-interacting factor 1-like isoform X2 n=1 Tax=Narcine bancroftii TaxID=1343680 RepID=UPI0038316866